MQRLEFQPFLLSVDEELKRHDSNQICIFNEVQNDLQLNTAFQALLMLKALVIHGMPTIQRPHIDYSLKKWICTLFSLRTITTPDLLGEPALEGVHTDGVDHTMMTFLHSQNMTPDSAVTMLYHMDEKTSIRFNEAEPIHIKGRVQHHDFLDTLIVADNEREHSLSPVYAVDGSRPAMREMFVFFTRKPATGGHVSAAIDSLNPTLSYLWRYLFLFRTRVKWLSLILITLTLMRFMQSLIYSRDGALGGLILDEFKKFYKL